jgi:hypothetical protein
MEQAMIYDPVLISKAEKLNEELEKVKAKYYKDVADLLKQMTPIDLSKYEDILK